MPPPEAVAGEHIGPGGKPIQVAPLSDEDRLTLVRWIDLGCPIDLDFNPDRPEAAGFGWMLDDQRPTLTLTSPRAGANPPLDRIVVGMYDLGGLAPESFQVVASFPVDGVAAGENLAKSFRSISPGVWELKLEQADLGRERQARRCRSKTARGTKPGSSEHSPPRRRETLKRRNLR